MLVIGGTGILRDGKAPEEGSKYRKAKKIGTKILYEEDFSKFLQESNKNSKVETQMNLQQLLGGGAAELSRGNATAFLQSLPEEKSKFSIKKVESEENVDLAALKKEHGHPGILWSELYKPRTLGEIIGNDSNIKKLRNWLIDWYPIKTNI